MAQEDFVKEGMLVRTSLIPKRDLCGSKIIHAGITIKINRDTVEVSNPYHSDEGKKYLVAFVAHAAWLVLINKVKAKEECFEKDEDGVYVLRSGDQKVEITDS